MDSPVVEIEQAARRLRQARGEMLSALSQADIVMALARLADCWRDPLYPLRLEAQEIVEPFPFAMVNVSLDALLDSLSPRELWKLIESENVRDAVGYPLVVHVIAGNTPLLAWTSVIRALLLRSASLVKLPSGSAAQWGHLFHRSLADVCPMLAACVELLQWPGGSVKYNTALCQNADMIVAYGSDETMANLHALCPAHTPFLAYGHRASFGLVLRGADKYEAARGLATDILLYDQSGCLSPQTVFVEGAYADVLDFGTRLAAALVQATKQYPLPCRADAAPIMVREARMLARMEPGTKIWEDPALRWTVIVRPEKQFIPSPGFGVVSVQPLASPECLPDALSPVSASLQGCMAAELNDTLVTHLQSLGISYICPPGQAQAPPLSWREDGRDVLRSLLPGAGQHNHLSR